MKSITAVLLVVTLLSTAIAQEGVPGAQSKPSQKWEYLIYFEREDDLVTTPIYITYGQIDKRYTVDDFAKAIGSKGAKGTYLNFKSDVVNYFGSQGWEMTGVFHETYDQGGPRLVMYFKRPIK